MTPFVWESGRIVLSDMNYDLLRVATRYYKENPKEVEIMCRAFEETRNEKAIQIARNLIAMGQLTLEMIAKATELPLSTVQALADGRSA